MPVLSMEGFTLPPGRSAVNGKGPRTAPVRRDPRPPPPAWRTGLDRSCAGRCHRPLFQREPTRHFAPMALKIRLSRIGSTHQPHYRIVVAETRSRRDGDAVETLGTYDPRTKGQQVKLRLDRVDYWISKGARPTDTLHSIIKRARRATYAASAAPQPAPETAPAPAS